MCGGIYSGEQDAAVVLAGILDGRSNWDAEDVRRLIRLRWDELKSLAHKIHSEEMSEEKKLDRAILQLSVLDKKGIKNVIDGKASGDVIEECKRAAKAILNASR